MLHKTAFSVFILLALLYTPTTFSENSASANQIPLGKGFSLFEMSQSLRSETNKPFIFPVTYQDSVKIANFKPGKITYSLFKKILRNNGFVALDSKEAISIVPVSVAKTLALPVVDINKGKLDDNDYVTTTIKVDHIDAQQLLSILRTLTPTHGHFTVYRPKNSLVLVDYWDNIKRMNEIIGELDKPLTDAEKAREIEREKKRRRKSQGQSS